MRITEIRELDVPLVGAISNAVVSFDRHKVSLVAVVTDIIRNGRPLVGVAFNSIGRHSQGGILRERMIPRVLEADPDTLLSPTTGLLDPARVLKVARTDEKPGGHGDRAAAASAIELAVWDVLAKYHDEPVYQTIARAYGRTPLASGAPVYAAGGYYQDIDDLGRLRAEIAGYRAAGYSAVKIKIGGVELGEDLRRIDAAIEVTGSGRHLAVDANGRFDRDQALKYAEALAPYGLRWYEEAVDPLDYALCSDLCEVYDGVIATGENLFSTQDVGNLLRFGGLRPDRDILQMDAGLSYGLTEYAEMIALMEHRGFDRTAAMPHGGHLMNLHIVVGLGLGGCEAYPGVFQPFGGYSDDCVLADGLIRPADNPGFGLEAKSGLAERIVELVT
ncbi:mandelate racemase [Rhodococcus sp. ACPA4]|uniref:L-alanine-DL-glutamate epimerase-like enolase superfamily enzyme n=1 Tax=Nocardia globerula TaxID=1818 RepID=A0A652YZL8_NOCGL|nr:MULTISPECIES: enolase C-terminal domain-like protein [Rhodococcus]NMD58657.1 mandelate racemase [Nocardia globerula]KJF19640.1 putative isomerase yitF [Rhodococcus sp. AD45]MCE4263832.1 mandelate racemase [Rhodococcus globerulus]NRI66397.1 mandelate racemase [Rhodococcus sp. MS16]PBC41344.1 mandelate racemase [Rhodococcus sp. ACPA4]